MGKNYTLYIKHDSFDAETNKSGLVNELLHLHYARGVGTAVKIKDKLYVANGTDPLKTYDATTEQTAPQPKTNNLFQVEPTNYTRTPTQPVLDTPSPFDHDVKFCQHGAVKGMCKKGCK